MDYLITKTYQTGNTIRFKCQFTDFEGEKVDPNLVKIIFYDYKYNQMENFMLGDGNKISEGEYYFDYILPSRNNQQIYYEWYAEIGGKPALKRDTFMVKFI